MQDFSKTKKQLIAELEISRSRLQEFELASDGQNNPILQHCNTSDFYLTILNDAPALIWRAALDAKCDWFNSTWLAFTGRDLSQEIGDGWAEGVHPEDFDACLQTYLEAFKARKFFEMEYRLRRHDGEYRWILDIGCPFKDPECGFGGYIGYCYDITERKRLETELVALATTDSLTGANNRRHFFKRAKEELYRSTRYDEPATLMLLDVDYFKCINDAYGHCAGDTTLKALSSACLSQLRPTDIFARIGGDEFAALFVHSNIVSSIQIIERLRSTVGSMSISISGVDISFTVSIGVTAILPDDNNFNEIMKRADLALYAAKNAGRDKVVIR